MQYMIDTSQINPIYANYYIDYIQMRIEDKKPKTFILYFVSIYLIVMWAHSLAW